MDTQQNTIFFENETQEALWQFELVGQISDGAWENSKPYHHWKSWCRANTYFSNQDCVNVLFGNTVRAVKRNYDFIKELCSVQCIRNRMIVFARLTKILGYNMANNAIGLFDTLDDDCPFRGMPNYEGGYWDKLREKLSVFNFVEIKRIGEDEKLYTEKTLIEDLKRISLAMKTQI